MTSSVATLPVQETCNGLPWKPLFYVPGSSLFSKTQILIAIQESEEIN